MIEVKGHVKHKEKKPFIIWYLKDNSFKIEIKNVRHKKCRIVNKYKINMSF